MGAATASLSHLVARHITGSNRVALLSGAAVALYFPLGFYTGLALTEAPSAFLLILAVWLSLRAADEPTRPRFAALAGLVFGVATVVRPNFLLALPLFYLYARARLGVGVPARTLALRVAAFALPALLLAAAHNTRVMGKPTGIATNGGLNFFLAHAEASGAQFQEGTFTHRIIPIPNSIRHREPFVSPVPFYDEKFFYSRGIDELAKRPYELITSLDNVIEGIGLGRQDYWPWWHGHERILVFHSRLTFWLLVLPTALSAFVLHRLGRLGSKEESGRLWLFLLCASTLAAMYVFLGDPRVRVPFDPLFIILSIDAWFRGTEALQKAAAPEA
jgi:4-amino-4-deoxy-L-arabinose transferase-like glycosyltransferase